LSRHSEPVEGVATSKTDSGAIIPSFVSAVRICYKTLMTDTNDCVNLE